jgi:peroxiredoxin
LLNWGCSPPTPGREKNESPFKDEVAWQASNATSLKDIAFQDDQGQTVDLKQFLGKKSVVLVITRGFQFSGYGDGVCVYCTSQTSRLIANYPQLKDRNAEVVVVFPIDKPEQAAARGKLMAKAQSQQTPPAERIPFPVWLDSELKMVTHLGIRADLSKPATYILDTAGQVRFAYVGNSMTDRPSVKAILNKLDELAQETKTP